MSGESIYAKAMSHYIYDIDVDVNTRHCCKRHGCKYGKDEECTVQITRHYGMTGNCQMCFDGAR